MYCLKKLSSISKQTESPAAHELQSYSQTRLVKTTLFSGSVTNNLSYISQTSKPCKIFYYSINIVQVTMF